MLAGHSGVGQGRTRQGRTRHGRAGHGTAGQKGEGDGVGGGRAGPPCRLRVIKAARRDGRGLPDWYRFRRVWFDYSDEYYGDSFANQPRPEQST